MRSSIRARLILVFISLAIGPLLVVGIILSWQSFAGLEQQALVLQQEAAKRVTSQVAAFFQELENELRLTVQTQIRGEPDRERQRNVLSNLLAYQRAFDELHLLDSQGQEQVGVYRIGLGSTTPLDRSQADEFIIPQTTGQVYYGPVRYDPITNEPVTTIALPVINLRTGLADGVLVAVARIKTVWDLIAGIQVSEGQSVYIVSAAGQVVAHRNPSVVLRGTSFAVPDEPGIQAGLSGGRVVLAFDTMSLGQQQFRVVAEQTVSEALALALNTILISAGLIVVALIFASVLGLSTVRQIVHPIRTMAAAAQAVSAGDLSQQVQITRRDEAHLDDAHLDDAHLDELDFLASTFNNMTTQLRSLVGGLEQRVSERTADLERRAVQLGIAADVSRAAASILDLEKLTSQVVNLVQERLSFYYVGLFLVDVAGRDAVLTAGTGEAGKIMLAQGHKLPVGGGSMVGTACATREARIALDVSGPGVSLSRFDNPLLPQTRSEVALPLIVGGARGTVLGALNVQSTLPAAFSEGDVTILQVVADQVAVAIQNARLYAESQVAVEATRRAYGEVSRGAWRRLLEIQGGAQGYTSAEEGLVPASEVTVSRLRALINEASRASVAPVTPLADHRPASSDERGTLALPIRVRDQVIGIIDAQKPEGTWTTEEQQVLEALVEQLGVALESARLYQDTQRRAAQERMVGEVTARMRETLDMDAVLRTAAQEIRQALGLSQLIVQLAAQPDELEGVRQ